MNPFSCAIFKEFSAMEELQSGGGSCGDLVVFRCVCLWGRLECLL